MANKHIATILNVSKSKKYKCICCKKIPEQVEEYTVTYKDYFFCNSACYSKFTNFTITPYVHIALCCKCKLHKNQHIQLQTFWLENQTNGQAFVVPQELYDSLDKETLIKQSESTKYNYSNNTQIYPTFKNLTYEVINSIPYRWGRNKFCLNICVECYEKASDGEKIISGRKIIGGSKKIALVEKYNEKTIKDKILSVSCKFCNENKQTDTWVTLTKNDNKKIFCSEECANLYILKGK
jgi:hypothetical protein